MFVKLEPWKAAVGDSVELALICLPFWRLTPAAGRVGGPMLDLVGTVGLRLASWGEHWRVESRDFLCRLQHISANAKPFDLLDSIEGK